MMNNEDHKDDNLIPIRDMLGNTLSVGSLVNFNPPPGFRNWIGKIVRFHPGGVLLTQGSQKGPTGQTPARVQILFDVTLTLQPGALFLSDIVRVVNPESEAIVSKILNEPTVQ